MKILKMGLSASALILVFLSLMFSSCEKEQATTSNSKVELSEEQEISLRNDDLVYLEITEEFLPPEGQETVSISGAVLFSNEDGDEIQGTIVIEVTVEDEILSSVAVSQNLVDVGIFDGGVMFPAK